MPRVLLVEDDLALQSALSNLLESEQYTVMAVAHGETALYEALTSAYDLVILDVILPGVDGFDIAITMRRHQIHTPIIMLTAKDHVGDRVRGLDAGADDYLVKPFASTELVARIRAQLRRSGGNFQSTEVLTFGPMIYRHLHRELTIGPNTVPLSPKEAVLIELFLRYPKTVLTRSQLTARLWADDSDILDNALEAHISKLRRKLQSAGGPNIVAVRGLGYRLDGGP